MLSKNCPTQGDPHVIPRPAFTTNNKKHCKQAMALSILQSGWLVTGNELSYGSDRRLGRFSQNNQPPEPEYDPIRARLVTLQRAITLK